MVKAKAVAMVKARTVVRCRPVPSVMSWDRAKAVAVARIKARTVVMYRVHVMG